MNKRLLTTPLVAATLLLGTLGCSKKDEVPAASGSYVLDGRTVNYTTQAWVQTLASSYSSAPTRHMLTVELTTTPEPASGPEKVELFFMKEATASPKTYLPSDLYLTNAANSKGVACTNVRVTLSEDAGLYSAKFEGSGKVTPFSALTAGVFKNVRPRN